MFTTMHHDFYPFTRPTPRFNLGFEEASICLSPQLHWAAELGRLQNEHDILENGLVTCVTYIGALRKKLARSERVLNTDPPPTRKRRRKIEQGKRLLEREIENRQRDEQAFLSNLQVCKANIHMAGGIRKRSVDLSSARLNYTPTTSQFSCEESAATEVSWNGWVENKIMSPFEKRHTESAFIDEIAPDEVEHGQHPGNVSTHQAPILSLPLRHREQNRTVSVPLKPIHCRSLLRPEASTFEPSTASEVRDDQHENGLSAAVPDDKKRINTWCNTTPQRSPRDEDGSKRAGGGRGRCNSL